jgi:hypothetical protein
MTRTQAYRRRASASLRQKSAFLLGDRIWIITQQGAPGEPGGGAGATATDGERVQPHGANPQLIQHL